MTGARIDTPLGEMVVGDRLEVPPGDQFRHIRVGDIVIGREEPPGCGWNEAILRCAWVGAESRVHQMYGQVVVWDVWTRRLWSLTRKNPQKWQHDGQSASWVLDGRPWYRLAPPPKPATRHTCPVCGFDDLEEEMDYGDICCRCGYEEGFDDENGSHAQLRARWEAAGRPWFSTYRHPPLPPVTDDRPIDDQTRTEQQ